MSALRLGAACAVFNDQGELLLVRRGDLGLWHLPSGRLDAGETLSQAAAREVREETGLEVAHIAPLGLYYYHGWERMNVLFVAQAAGGTLRQHTAETRAAQFAAAAALPEPRMDTRMIEDALARYPHLFQVDFAPAELQRLRRQFALRWLKNLVSGRPEPRFVRFTVHASLAIRDAQDNILALLDARQQRILPGVECDGQSPVWEQVRKYVRDHYDLYEMRSARLNWSGLYHDVAARRLEFIFSTRLSPESPLTLRSLEWQPATSRAWWHGYRPYLRRLLSDEVDVLTLYQLPKENEDEPG
ncbi:MAG: NUDIX hydrolase [Anaerolineae bacterium]|jgi:ADP-ribose pyrophosphatase YjhB (NUDIX family)|nr:NUDIX hydrolase [Anaerolineae bacterium]